MLRLQLQARCCIGNRYYASALPLVFICFVAPGMPIFLSHIQSSTAFFSCSIHCLSYSQNSVRVSGMKKSYCIRKKNQNNITGYLESKIQTIMSTSATLSFSCPPNTFLFCSIIFFSFSSISSYQQHPWKHGGVSNQINYFFPSLLFCMATQESNS